MGEETSELRNKEVSELLDYAYATYKINTILKSDDVIKKINIDGAKERIIELVPSKDVTILNKKIDSEKEYTYDISLDKIKAPIKKGDRIGTISVLENGNVIHNVDITVKKDVLKANILELYFRYLKELVSI